ncbi:MAG: EpsG family protein [Methylotenera sp.]|uniref:EpsG family protein n=1 Tax=Methylotenera sp. TaxID=2051956 RepID=UPI00272F426F|nr:EpsG family protein [Methylotenera sp.]MDP1522641.1 EpsG family protein [Methylotenera sp.]
MYVYITAYLFIISLSPLILLKNRNRTFSSSLDKSIFILGLLPAILVAVLRGDVGTDTVSYLEMSSKLLENSDTGYQDINVEIGFYWILKSLVFLLNDARLPINLLSFIIAIYSYFLFFKEKQRILIYSFLIFPIFFFDMSMNGLRYGLAFLLAKHASDMYENNKNPMSLALMVLCVSIQMSGILVFLLLQLKRIKLSNFAFLVPIIFIFLYIFEERLLEKYASYQEFSSPSLYSGIFPLFIFASCYGVLVFSKVRKIATINILFFAEVSSFLLAKFSYAGLRFQFLILFVLFCLIADIKLREYKNKSVVIALFIVIGLCGFLGKLKNFTDEYTYAATPFLPYELFWNAE